MGNYEKGEVSKRAVGINEIAKQVVIGNISQVPSKESNLDVTERSQTVQVESEEQRKKEISVAQAIQTEADVANLMQQIIECGLKAKSTDSECHIVWESQGCTCLDDFHVPEPWNGDIANAELLFLSINPGYMANELYPRLGNKWWRDENGRWAVDRLNDFFTNRFSSKNQYVRNDHGFSLRMEDGAYKALRGHTFWGDINRIATLILNRDAQIGRDYALTEIVHCKTKNQGGLRSRCYTKCMNLWLKKVLNVARKVKRIVVIGGNPRTRICRFVEPKIDAPQRYKYKWYERSVPDGKKLNWLFIDHPAAYQCKPVLQVEKMVNSTRM